MPRKAYPKNQSINELVDHLLEAQDKKMLKERLNNLLTPAEMHEIGNRLQIFKLLEAGVPQRQIAETLGVGIATVTRGSRALQRKTPS